MVRIAHFSDLHIKNLKHHFAYRQVFQSFLKLLETEKVDVAIFTGDLAHTKTNLSPEYFDITSQFLFDVANVVPLYLILGNHDFNVRSKGRQDAVSPVVDALKHPNIRLLKYSGETEIEENIVLNTYSLLDKENWKGPTDPSKTNICLYHGAVRGSETDVGWVIQNGENISIFENFDYVMLGDIHRSNQILDSVGRVRYAGSMVQQNFGEEDDKGFLIWDIESKDTFSVKHITIPNPQPFITLSLTKKGRIPKDTEIPENARVRLVSDYNLPFGVMKRAIEIVSAKFKPESVTYLNRLVQKDNGDNGTFAGLEIENLRSTKTQEKLIESYLKDFEIDADTLQRVKDLNKKYKEMVENDEDVSRNVSWKIKKIAWNNLFNYGNDNEINFENLKGIVGIFGKSFSGKSSIIDTLAWTIYNSTSKNERKNLNVINQNRTKGTGRAEIEIGDKTYTIDRISEKYEKKLKGEVTLEAKTDVEFNSTDLGGNEEIHNGLTRNDTDKNVRKVFGSIEDFLLTSMSSQFGSLDYINEGSTKRKEILAKFLDLEVFEKKFKIAKEDVADAKASLKKLEGREFDKEIEQARKKIDKNETILASQKEECERLNVELAPLRSEIERIKHDLEREGLTFDDLDNFDLDAAKTIKKRLELKSEGLKQLNSEFDVGKNEEEIGKIDEFLSKNFDIEKVKSQKKEIEDLDEKMRLTKGQLIETQYRYETNQEKGSLLKEVPCGSKFPDCKFICNAHKSLKCLGDIKKKETELGEDLKTFQQQRDKYDEEKINTWINNYNKLVEKKNSTIQSISEYNKRTREIEETEQTLNPLLWKIKFYEENIGEKEKELKEKEDELKKCIDQQNEHYRLQGSLDYTLKSLEDQKEELSNLRKEYQAYDLFLRCCHSDGISYEIIKKQLPVINEEIAKILVNVVDFEVYFENNGRKLDIWIKHPKYSPRPLEMGSGAERVLSALAIRLALIKVSSLPKSNLFILDEPATQLDGPLMENFIMMLNTLKESFETIILISHLDVLKDCADIQIDIEKKGGYAYVNI